MLPEINGMSFVGRCLAFAALKSLFGRYDLYELISKDTAAQAVFSTQKYRKEMESVYLKHQPVLSACEIAPIKKNGLPS